MVLSVVDAIDDEVNVEDEMRISKDKADVIARIGFPNSFPVEAEELLPQLIHMKIRNRQDSTSFLCMVVHASPQPAKRQHLWSILDSMAESVVGSAVCNSEWELFAPNCVVCHLHRLKFDHRPILVSLCVLQGRSHRPFRCLANWIMHAEFNDLVKGCWKNNIEVTENLDNFQKVVQDWNKRV
ncbi:hypothetical protein Goklo_013374, partial [Gossypium klotzschianum]|nr:hypothetical protein [Gossypium klotzschianum]